MRSITWLCVLACLVVATQAIQLPNIEEPEEDVLDELAEDEDIDMGEILRDLFEDEEIDEDGDDEEVTGRQMATVTTSEQDRYNTFMDTLLSQLERQARRDLEPLKLTLTSPKKKNKTGKKKNRKNSKKNAKKDKNNRDSKDVEIVLPEIADITDEPHQIEKRDADAELDEEVTGRQNNNGNKKEKKNRDEENTKEKKNKNRKNNNLKKNNKKNNKRKGRSNNKVVLHGLSHIVREGDVKLYNMKNGRALVTEFNIGPVELDITRKFGSGEESKAAASAKELKGKLMLKVNKDGKPRIKKLSIKRPKDITMSGSVARSNSSNSGKGFMKKSVKQVSPTAAKKLLKAAKAIIQSV